MKIYQKVKTSKPTYKMQFIRNLLQNISWRKLKINTKTCYRYPYHCLL